MTDQIVPPTDPTPGADAGDDLEAAPQPKRPRAPRAPKPAAAPSDHPDAVKVADQADAIVRKVGDALAHLPERDVRRVAFRRDAADLASVVEAHGVLVAKREAAIASHNEAMRLLGLEIDDARALVGSFEARVKQLAGRQAR